jgi:site-specific DNA-methyltransferase (adenine-specific)
MKLSYEMRQVEALEGLKSLPDASVDLVVSDPPYNTLEKHREVGTTTRLKNSKQSSNEWFPTVDFDYLFEVFKECYRVLRRPSHLYVMCDEETADILKPGLRDIGFEQRKSLIWEKVGKLEKVSCPSCGAHVTERHRPGTPGMSYPWRSCYEMILFFQKGKRPAAEDRSQRNVLRVPWIKSTAAYPTEKPVELLERIIAQSSLEGDLVLDPFAGSGSCGEAAFNLRRSFLGFDVEDKAVARFEERRQQWVYEDPEDAPPVTGGILDFFGE